MVVKSDIVAEGAFRSKLRADNEFSLNLWRVVNIEGYNRWDLIGLWKFIRPNLSDFRGCRRIPDNGIFVSLRKAKRMKP